MPSSKRNDRLTIRCIEEVWQQDERASGLAGNLLDHAF
jgi:hypothetical protein